MSDELTLHVENRLSELKRVNQAVHDFLDGQPLAPKSQYTIHIAIEEMITNTIKYGYDDDAAHEIELSLRIAGSHVLIRIEDDGHEFNPLLAEIPDITAPIEKRRIGGMGIYMVRKMADDIRYQRMDGKNILDVSVRLGER